MPDSTPDPEDVALSLTLAVGAASLSPLLLLDDNLGIVAASLSFCEAFGVAEADPAGKPLYALAGGRWDIPELRHLLGATVSGALRSDGCVNQVTAVSPE